MANFYSGIGSRETPTTILDYMESVANVLQEKGYILRSGGADGADSAFERGAGERKEIYIPWDNFRTSMGTRKGLEIGVYTLGALRLEKDCRRIARKIHPAWKNCTRGAQALHSRNVHQVLGQRLDSPSSFVLCWTQETKSGIPKGGTATAINLAKEQGIPVYNLFCEGAKEAFERDILGDD